MAIEVEIFGASSVDRSLRTLQQQFPKEADRAAQDAAKRARTEFAKQARKITTIVFRRATTAVGGVSQRSVAGGKAFGFLVKARRPGIVSFQHRRLPKGGNDPESGAPVQFRIFRADPPRRIRRAFTTRRGGPSVFFARVTRKRLPIFALKGVSMAWLWDNTESMRRAVVKRGQSALALGVNTRIARLMQQGRV